MDMVHEEEGEVCKDHVVRDHGSAEQEVVDSGIEEAAGWGPVSVSIEAGSSRFEERT